MTKMHMEWAAGYVRRDIDETEDKVQVANAYAAMFAHFNARFDRARFMLACGLDASR